MIRGFQAACAAVVRQFGGTISRYMGDGILVLFGYPHAHEDDAERAVRAGLSMVQAVARLPAAAGGGRAAGGPRGNSDRTRGRGRPHRRRLRRGGSHPRRDAEPRRPAARLGAAGRRGHRFQHACAPRRALPLREPRVADDQGLRRADPGLAGDRAAVDLQPFQGRGRSPADAHRRQGGRPRVAARPLAIGDAPARTRHHAGGRGRNRQVACRRGAARSARRRLRAPALPVLAALRQSRAASDHPAHRARRRHRRRGSGGDRSWRSSRHG